MNKLIVNFQKNINSIAMFVYLITVILITLLFNNPLILIGLSISLFIMLVVTRREKIKVSLKFASIIFLVTVIFNLILNQRGTNVLLEVPLLKITTESLINAAVLGLSFVNLLWAFSLYDALIRIKTIFELLANVFKSIAIIFILTVKFIPQIIKIYTETKAISKFRVEQVHNDKFLKKIKQTIDLNEIVLNKAIASFMNVSDTLILKGYDHRKSKLGKTEFKRGDWLILCLTVGVIVFNTIMSVRKLGKINFGSANLHISSQGVSVILIVDSLFILLPLLMGGINYLWWRFYSSKITVSDTITAKNYR